MDYKKNHFRQILLYYFFRRKSAAQATRKLREVYGNEALKERQCRNWFTRFRTGDFSLKDEPHTGRPHEVVDDEIKAFIEADPYISIRGLGDKLQVHFSTIDRHLQRLGYVKNHNIWVLQQTESASTSRCLSPQKQRLVNESEVNIDPLECSKLNDAMLGHVSPNVTPAEKVSSSNCEKVDIKTSSELKIENCDEVHAHEKLCNYDKKGVSLSSRGRIRKKSLKVRK